MAEARRTTKWNGEESMDWSTEHPAQRALISLAQLLRDRMALTSPAEVIQLSKPTQEEGLLVTVMTSRVQAASPSSPPRPPAASAAPSSWMAHP